MVTWEFTHENEEVTAALPTRKQQLSDMRGSEEIEIASRMRAICERHSGRNELITKDFLSESTGVESSR